MIDADYEIACRGWLLAAGQRGALLLNGSQNVLGVVLDAVIVEQIEFPLQQALQEAAPAIATSPDAGELANLSVVVQGNLVAAVPIAPPGRRHAGHNVVVVNPTVMRDRGV